MNDTAPQPAPHNRRAIVAGFGPVGRLVTERLEADGFTVTVIELNEKTCERQARLQRATVFGDVREAGVLEEAGIAQAEALILAIPDEEQAIAACTIARELRPGIFIAARTNFFSRGLLASSAGADAVVVEEVVTAEAMERAVMDRLHGSGR